MQEVNTGMFMPPGFMRFQDAGDTLYQATIETTVNKWSTKIDLN